MIFWTSIKYSTLPTYSSPSLSKSHFFREYCPTNLLIFTFNSRPRSRNTRGTKNIFAFNFDLLFHDFANPLTLPEVIICTRFLIGLSFASTRLDINPQPASLLCHFLHFSYRINHFFAYFQNTLIISSFMTYQPCHIAFHLSTYLSKAALLFANFRIFHCTNHILFLRS